MFNTAPAYRFRAHWQDYYHRQRQNKGNTVDQTFLWHEYKDKIESAWGDLGMLTLSQPVWDTVAAFNRLWSQRKQIKLFTKTGKRRTYAVSTEEYDGLIATLAEEIGDWDKEHQIAQECRHFGVGALIIAGAITCGKELRYDGKVTQYSIKGRRQALWEEYPEIKRKRAPRAELVAWLRPRWRNFLPSVGTFLSRELFAFILYTCRSLYPGRRGHYNGMRLGIRICKWLRSINRAWVSSGTRRDRFNRIKVLTGSQATEKRNVPWLITAGDMPRPSM